MKKIESIWLAALNVNRRYSVNSFIKSAFDLQLQSEIAVSSLCTATHFLECLDLGTKLTNLDSLCDY